MIKIGMMGLNSGNGHPFWFSAIFNGYDPLELEKRCPFPLIKQYLPVEHRNEVFIDSAKVTHIWTQDRKISEDVAKVSRIPHIVNQYEDLLGQVDAVILARDDIENHLIMAKPFLKKGIPVFIDKQLAATPADLMEFMDLTGPAYPLMAGSSMRFSRDLQRAQTDLNRQQVKTIHGVSRVNWLRYGHHLLEGICVLWGWDIEWVRSLSANPEHDVLQIQYRSGPHVILEFVKELELPIQFTCYSQGAPAKVIPFTDYFHSFREMLKSFVAMVETKVPPIAYNEILGIARVILAGDLSKKMSGVPVSPQTLKAI